MEGPVALDWDSLLLGFITYLSYREKEGGSIKISYSCSLGNAKLHGLRVGNKWGVNYLTIYNT